MKDFFVFVVVLYLASFVLAGLSSHREHQPEFIDSIKKKKSGCEHRQKLE